MLHHTFLLLNFYGTLVVRQILGCFKYTMRRCSQLANIVTKLMSSAILLMGFPHSNCLKLLPKVLLTSNNPDRNDANEKRKLKFAQQTFGCSFFFCWEKNRLSAFEISTILFERTCNLYDVIQYQSLLQITFVGKTSIIVEWIYYLKQYTKYCECHCRSTYSD